MTIPLSMIAEKIVDVLMAGNYKVELYDEEGNLVYDKKEARKFFTNPGKHMISIHDDGDGTSHLKVSLSPPVDIQEFETSIGKKLRTIAAQVGDNMAYDVRTFGKELAPKDFAHETIGEEIQMTDVTVNENLNKMTGTSRSSYQKVGECRLIVRHTNRVNENKFGARSRNIHSIFVETKGGERFRMAENSLHGARAMARHLSNSGTPFDTVGSKITGMVKEMAELRNMVKEARALRKSDYLSEDANGLVEQIRNRYIGIRETLRKMTGKVGYFTQTADLQESDRIDELEYDLSPTDRDKLRIIARKKGLPVPGEKEVEPSQAMPYTSSDKDRMLRQAASDYHWAEYKVRIDPTVPEQAHKINDIVQFPGFLKSKQHQDFMNKIGESDEFDEAMLYELEYDVSNDPASGIEKYTYDPNLLTRLSGIQKVAYLLAEVLSPKPSGDIKIDKMKEIVQSMDDEDWNIWSRVSESLAKGQPPHDKREKAAFLQAAKMFSEAGYGPFSESVEMEGKQPWGKSKSSDMEDRMIDKMVQKGMDAPALRKKRPYDKYDDMAKKRGLESVQEAEEEGKITSTTQKYKYESNVSEFDRPTGGKKAHDTNHVVTDLSRDNAENMHSENMVEKELPEYGLLEAWFDDMVRVEFFNEQEIDEKWHKGKKKTEDQKDDSESINEAFDKLNFSKTADEFDGFLNEYIEKGILDKILELVEEGSNLYKVIQERRPIPSATSPVVEPEEQRLEKAFLELSVIVNDRSKSLEQAIQELSQDFEDPENIANILHQKAREAGLEKSDYGSTMADDVLSPNQEIQQGKAENKSEEFYGRARFGETVNNERIIELAGISKKKNKLNEAAPYNKALGRQAVGTWDRPGSMAMQRGANKAQRQADKREIGAELGDIHIHADDNNQQGIQADAPYAIVWHGQYRENYGAHDWDGQGEAPQHWKSKGDAGSVLAKNILDWQTAEDLLAKLSQTDRSESNDYTEIYADDPKIVSMSELGKHFHGYDPAMQEYGAKPEQDDDKDIIDMANEQQHEEIEPELNEQFTDQNMARIIQLAKFRNGLYNN